MQTAAQLKRTSRNRHQRLEETNMTKTWTTPTLTEICVGLEINGYLPAEF
jgi:coenzyme PQQ precursor peptide PqqA